MSDRDDENLGHWVRKATPVANPSAVRRAAAFDAVRREWQDALKNKNLGSEPTENPTPDTRTRGDSTATEVSRQKRWWPAALAAGIVLAVSVLTPFAINAPVITQIAAVQGAGGSIHASFGPKAWLDITRPLISGETLREGEWIETAPDSALLFSLGDDLSLRVAGDTHLAFTGSDQFELVQGAVYIESNAEKPKIARPLSITTELGAVTHVGTRYLVQLTESKLEVMVREGLVRLDHLNGKSFFAEAGNAIRLNPGDADPATTPIAFFDEAFTWLAAIPRPLNQTEVTLREFFDWYQRETGKEIILDNNASSIHLDEIIVTGDVTMLSPETALDAVALSSELSIQRQSGQTRVDMMTQ